MRLMRLMTQVEMLRHHRRAIENAPATTDRQRLDKSAALAAIDRLIELTESKTCDRQLEHSGGSRHRTLLQD